MFLQSYLLLQSHLFLQIPLTNLKPHFPISHYPRRKTSPSKVNHSGTSYHPGSGKMYPPREVANDEGTIRVHMSFSLNKLTSCKQRLDQFSEDPSKFVKRFQVLTLAFGLLARMPKQSYMLAVSLRKNREFGQQPRGRLTSLPGTNLNILLWVETMTQIKRAIGIIIPRREQKPRSI